MDKKITVIGGGTGIAHLLRGLKQLTSELTAIVAMTDDGGGSGMIRKDLGLLPPGDVRNCLSALSNDAPLMEELLQYRFTQGMLEGQNFGNLLIVALNRITGSFEQAIGEISKVLNITGQVLPVTTESVHLVAEYANGEKCIGESRIPEVAYRLGSPIEKMGMFPRIPRAYEPCIRAIEQGDLIILGPGSLYTSIISNVLVEGIAEALKRTKGKKIFIINAMTQRGETGNFSAADHVRALEKQCGKGLVDGVVIHTAPFSPEDRKRYLEKSGSVPVFLTEEDREFFRMRGIRVLEGSFVVEEDNRFRHDGKLVGSALLNTYFSG